MFTIRSRRHHYCFFVNIAQTTGQSSHVRLIPMDLHPTHVIVHQEVLESSVDQALQCVTASSMCGIHPWCLPTH